LVDNRPEAAALNGLVAMIARGPRAAFPARQGPPVLQLMSIGAATVAKDEQKWVWVRRDERWVRGKIQDIDPQGIATIDLGNGATLKAPVDDVHDTPPPDVGLGEGSETSWALVPTGPSTLAKAPQEVETSPEVTHYYELLAPLSETLRKNRIRDLLRTLHPDKGGDSTKFNAFSEALDLLKNGPSPKTGAPLPLTYGNDVSLHYPRLHVPPPDVGSMALVPSGPPSTLAKGSQQVPTSPEAQHYYELLTSLSEAMRKNRIRDLLRTLHPDKGGDAMRFKAFQEALDLFKNGPPPPKTGAPLALAYGEVGLDYPRLREGPFTAQEIAQLSMLTQVERPEDIGRLAGTRRTVPDLVALAALRTAVMIGDLISLTAIPRAITDLARLETLTVVGDVADLARLAGARRTARDLVALAALRTAVTLDDLISLAAIPWPVAALAQLETLTVVGDVADLRALAISGVPLPRLAAFAVLPQVTDRATLLEVAAIQGADADVVALAQLPQAAAIADLRLLCGLIGTKTVADIMTIAGIGSPTFAPPSAQQVSALCQLPKTAQEIVVLSNQPGIGNTAQLLVLVAETSDRDTAGDTWHVLDERWEQIKHDWAARWPLTGVFAAVTAAWDAPSRLVRTFTSRRETPASPADLQTFALAVAAMRSTLNLIDQMAPAVDDGQRALGDANARLAALATLLTEIDNHLRLFYGPGAARNTVLLQRGLVVNAQATLNAELAQIQIDRTNYAQLNALTALVVAQAVQDQNNHVAVVGAVQTAAAIDAPLVALRTAAYQDRLVYPNLNLTQTIVAHGFWQSLVPGDKARLNTKLQGFPVTNWGTQGYPGTRARQHGYGGGQIQIPTLAGFPVGVGGEVVHDWIFPSPGHGHSAQHMSQMINNCLTGTPWPSGLGPLAPDNEVLVGRTVYGFENVAIRIVITDPPRVLITFYNPS
jgi:hypothetical protein